MDPLVELFGEHAPRFIEISDRVEAEVNGRHYPIMNTTDFEKLWDESITEGTYIYWLELLQRAHIAASTNLFRHARWMSGCAISYSGRSFLTFAASLRGLIEATGDALDGLNGFPAVLAENHDFIRKALDRQPVGPWDASELEEKLIHFQFGRKKKPGEELPEGHAAKSASDYLRAFGSGHEPVKKLYGELCQVVHPAFQSMAWSLNLNQDGMMVQIQDEGKLILDWCVQYKEEIDGANQICLNSSLMILKALNFFEIPVVKTNYLDAISLAGIPAWPRIEQLFLAT